MGRYTPGPWEAEPSLRGFEIRASHQRVGEVASLGDALLAAAAPDLMEAALLALSSWERGSASRVAARSALREAVEMAIGAPKIARRKPVDSICNEQWLEEQIHKTWGEHGAHAEIYRDILGAVEWAKEAGWSPDEEEGVRT